MKKGYSQVTTGHYVKQSSYLMDYLAAHGMEDLSAVTLENIYAYIRTLAARKQTAIPSVWTHEELKRLIGAIDRGSPKGKRDYAIILIACRLGLRCTDIKGLRFENFNWAEKKLCFVQSKTKQPM